MGDVCQKFLQTICNSDWWRFSIHIRIRIRIHIHILTPRVTGSDPAEAVKLNVYEGGAVYG